MGHHLWSSGGGYSVHQELQDLRERAARERRRSRPRAGSEDHHCPLKLPVQSQTRQLSIQDDIA